jgi:hypothetical protein
MASSFDQVSLADTTYHEVMALYAAIKDTPGAVRVERAEMRQGEVKALPIDFLIDVELKAKRALSKDIDPAYAMQEWMHVVMAPEQYPFVPVVIREELGREFDAKRLGVDGDYRMLYFRVKNHSQNFQEEPSGIFE